MSCPGRALTLKVSQLRFVRLEASYTATVLINAGSARYAQSTFVQGWNDIPEEDWPDTPTSVYVDAAEIVSIPVASTFVSVSVNSPHLAGSWTVESDGDFAFRDPYSDFCPNLVTGDNGASLGWCLAGGILNRPIQASTDEGGEMVDGFLVRAYPLCLSEIYTEGPLRGTCCGAATGGDGGNPPEPPTPPEPPPELPPIVTGRPVVPRKNTMPVPGINNISTFACTTNSGTVCDSQTDATRNPYFNQDANPASSIRLEPSTLTIFEGRLGKIRVVAVHEDGQEVDVTSLATFNSPTSTIAESAGSGYVIGRDTGSAYIEVSWEGFSDRCSVTVEATPCARDAVIIIDQSLGSAVFPYKSFEAWSSATATNPIRQLYWHPTTQTSVDLLDDILAMAQGQFSLRNAWNPDDTGTDSVAVILTGDNSPYVAKAFTSSAGSVTFAPYSATKLGTAIQMAGTIFDDETVTGGLVIVVTNNGGNHCSPSASSAATALKADGHKLAVLTPTVAAASAYAACNYPAKAFATMQSMASSGLFFGGVTVPDWANKLQQAVADSCP